MSGQASRTKESLILTFGERAADAPHQRGGQQVQTDARTEREECTAGHEQSSVTTPSVSWRSRR
ncbi:hypothetical protein GCM10011578_070190 [Streptomyces fuscichromogenes]|uniref:Uncharacterized protein n=1 Tax=Streptomyces fuscichromogenes TaxID=1324013 RepID=A0A918CUY4_9ACTN|nr:hypothetical protein GCM10011578_070190 [Streptomyces fuscichromogenes]